jgi:hypothetical protein
MAPYRSNDCQGKAFIKKIGLGAWPLTAPQNAWQPCLVAYHTGEHANQRHRQSGCAPHRPQHDRFYDRTKTFSRHPRCGYRARDTAPKAARDGTQGRIPLRRLWSNLGSPATSCPGAGGCGVSLVVEYSLRSSLLALGCILQARFIGRSSGEPFVANCFSRSIRLLGFAWIAASPPRLRESAFFSLLRFPILSLCC